MSVVFNSPFKKPECSDAFNLGGDSVQSYLRDVLGGLINVQAVGTDPDIVQPIDGLNMLVDYFPYLDESTVNPGHTRVNPDGTFLIIPETDAATYQVVLEDGTQFMITAVQSTAYLGQIIPMRLLKVLAGVGTTGYFSVVY